MAVIIHSQPGIVLNLLATCVEITEKLCRGNRTVVHGIVKHCNALINVLLELYTVNVKTGEVYVLILGVTLCVKLAEL